MSSIRVDYDILNQKQTPAFYASSLATRPAFGFPGRIFIDTDTPSSGIYRDTGSAWIQVADPGAGTTGTLQQVTTNGNTTTLGIQVQGIDINDGAGTGTGNVVFGNSSLQGNTTGYNNTAIGNNSLVNNTTGANNTAIGNGSLAANTTASNNTAIGLSSLSLNTTGASNTGVGVYSLQSNATGSLNTAIGYTAGQLITTGSNNTILGNYVGTSTLASNIVLSDGAGNVRLFSDANGLIGINQAVGSTIGGQLDIHTTQTYALVLNGLSTSNAYTAFSNANVGKWRIGNTYNAGANSFDIFNLGTSSNALSFNSTTNAATFSSIVTIGGRIDFSANSSATAQGQIGRDAAYGLFNFASTGVVDDYAIFSASGAYIMHTPTGTANTVLGGALSGTSATFSSSVSATSGIFTNGSAAYALNATSSWTASASNNPIITFGRAGNAVAGAIGYDEIQTAIYIGTTTAHNFLIKTDNTARLTITTAGIINTTSRLNVNGATDNALFSLNSGGTLYTVGFSPNATANSNNTLTLTTAQTTWIYTGTGLATWTLPTPSGTNQMFWIKNAGTGIITLNAFAGTNIIDNSATSVSSITIAVGATVLIQQDGNVKSYQLQ